MLRSDLSMTDQLAAVVRSCYYNIRQLRAIRSSLTRDALRDAAYALVLSRLDYCNALYVNMPDSMMQQLQMLINTAACVISGRGRFWSITDFIRDTLRLLPAE